MTDATFTNGRYELPAHARGVLVLADPPEAGWRLELPPDEGSHLKLNRLPVAGDRGAAYQELPGESEVRVLPCP